MSTDQPQGNGPEQPESGSAETGQVKPEQSEFEQIAPAKIEITLYSAPELDDDSPRQSAPSSPQNNWVWPGLIALLVVALGVIFLLPQWVETPELDPATLEQGRVEARAGTPSPGADISPWQEAQLARDRKQAQDVLAELVDRQFQLEELMVELWAAEAFAGAKAVAAEGDDLYREKSYAEAAQRYQASLEQLDQLIASVENVIETNLAKGQEAILSGEVETALESFQLVLNIRMEHEQAAEGLARAEKLEQVLALMAQARDSEAADDLDQARARLQEALALDAKTVAAQENLTRVNALIKDRDYQAAMSRGYAALAQSQYDQARRAFNQARALKPSSAEAQDGLDQVGTQIAQNKIDALRDAATGYEAREAWAQALQQYEKVLDVDTSVIFAQQGVKRTSTRARLDQLLQERLDNPQRLTDAEVYGETQRLLGVAAKVSEPGPRLRGQVEEIRKLLSKVATPIVVTFQSDNETEVTLYKVAHLGSFDSHQLSLKPGSYVAVGKKPGFRDVRREFQISYSGAVPEPIVIQCVERI